IAGIGLIASLAVYSLGRLLFSARAGLWTAAFFYSTPLVSWLTGTAHTDLLVVLYVTAAAIAPLQWYRSRRIHWLLLTSILAASGVAVKLNAMYATIGFGAALIALLVKDRGALAKKVRIAATLALFAALVALPWYATTYVHTGNPVFPLMNGIFKSPRAEAVNRLMNAADFGIGTSLPALLRLPFRLALDSSRFGEAQPAGTLGPLLLLFIPFGLIAIFSTAETRIL